MHQKLKDLRIKKGYRCLDIANVLGISKTFYWQIENGKRTLTYHMAVKIARIFKTKPDNLFFEDFKNCD